MSSRTDLHQPSTFGQRIADAVVNGMGSWWFIGIQTTIIVVWVALNCWFLMHPFDRYPLILLNLVFSTQAAYASPLILMAANRQAQKDRARDDLEAEEVNEIHEGLELLKQINQQQLEILHELRGK